MKYLLPILALVFPSPQPQTMTGEAAVLLAYATMQVKPSLETPDLAPSGKVPAPSKLVPYKQAHAAHPDEPFLVMVTASWCGPCQDIKPAFEALPGTKVYVDYDNDRVARSLVRGRISLPYFIYFGRSSTRRGNNLQQVYGGGE
jgi:thiol-disulfide isomerase/thioredoxin